MIHIAYKLRAIAGKPWHVLVYHSICKHAAYRFGTIYRSTGPPAATAGGGVNYIRWGRTTCPNTTGTEVLYTGVIVGAGQANTGGGADYLCLTDDAQPLEVTPGNQVWRGRVEAAEYQTACDPTPALQSIYQFEAPCVACYSGSRGNRIMIPGTINCTSSWTREYYGYLISNVHDSKRTTFICLDVDAEGIAGTQANDNRAWLYFVEVRCPATQCPHYTVGDELSCVVCTK